MKTIRITAVLLLTFFAAQLSWAESDTTPSLFSLTYYELYGTPIEPLSYAQTTTDALGFDVLAEYNPSYYVSLGLNYEKTTFYDSLNTTVSFLGIETRFFGAPNGKSSFAPYIYGGAGLGLSSGSGNQLKAGLGSRIQLFSPIALDFSAGSNWLDSGLQYLNFRGGLSVSFDLPKVDSSPTAKPTEVLTQSTTTSATPTITATPVNTVADILIGLPATSTPTNTETVGITATTTETATDTPTMDTPTATATTTPMISVVPLTPAESKVKNYYRMGMKAFVVHHYLTAVTNFKKALAVDDPSVQSYFYAESDAMLGVIYQFHLTNVPGHNKLAVRYYKRALKIDPKTKSAKRYLRMLQAPKAVQKAPAGGDESVESTTAQPTSIAQPTTQPATIPTEQPATQTSPVIGTSNTN